MTERVQLRVRFASAGDEQLWATAVDAGGGTYRLESNSFSVPLAAGDLVRADSDAAGRLQVVDVVEPCDGVLTIFAPDATAAPDAVTALMDVWRMQGAGWTEHGGPFLATVVARYADGRRCLPAQRRPGGRPGRVDPGRRAARTAARGRRTRSTSRSTPLVDRAGTQPPAGRACRDRRSEGSGADPAAISTSSMSVGSSQLARAGSRDGRSRPPQPPAGRSLGLNREEQRADHRARAHLGAADARGRVRGPDHDRDRDEPGRLLPSPRQEAEAVPDHAADARRRSATGTITTYTFGKDLYADMLAAIEGAQRQVLFETYIWKGDAVGEQFKAALAAAADRGRRGLLHLRRLREPGGVAAVQAVPADR